MAEWRVRPEQLRGLSEEELNGQLQNLRRQLWDRRLKAKAGAFQQLHEFKALKRQIARVETVLRMRKSTPSAAGTVPS